MQCTADPSRLVFDLPADVGERNPLSTLTAAQAAAVAALEGIAAQYAKTRVPQATGDPSCPKFSGINTTDPSGSTALYVGPWCD
jgi:hypothetical protein